MWECDPGVKVASVASGTRKALYKISLLLLLCPFTFNSLQKSETNGWLDLS